MTCLVRRDETLVQLLAGADAGDDDLAAGGHRLREVDHAHARDARHEYLAAAHALERGDHEGDALLERQPETGHALVGERDAAEALLLLEKRDDAATAADDVAVAHAGEARSLAAGVCVALHEELLGC